jgi:hypothetical protein
MRIRENVSTDAMRWLPRTVSHCAGVTRFLETADSGKVTLRPAVGMDS